MDGMNIRLFKIKQNLFLDPIECKDFIKFLKSSEYKLLKEEFCPLWISKEIDVIDGGLKIIQKEEEEEFLKIYNKEKKCSSAQNPMLIQRYISSPLLINKHKFDIRSYILIASTNPLVVYFYNDGMLRFALRNYGGFSNRV